ncbi:MAG: Globin domain-containing protein, partial [Cocleimonas sp.]|nr:Globin domain-containing protein [Cocleimonas sp.]
MNLSDITETVFQSIPHTIIPTEQDTKLLRKHKKLLLSYGNDLAKGVYHDDNLQETLSPEVRKQREQSLHEWYQISITCDFDQHYWNWQVFVGVEHVKHNVSNASVLTMWVWIMTSMQQNLLRDLETSEALKVLSVFQKLQAVVT